MKQDTVRIVLFNRLGHVAVSFRHNTEFLAHRWQVPGGRIDPTDKTAVCAALREITEETGLKLNHIHLQSLGSKRMPSWITYLYRAEICLTKSLKNPEPHLHSDWRWIPLEHALELNMTGGSREALLVHSEVVNQKIDRLVHGYNDFLRCV